MLIGSKRIKPWKTWRRSLGYASVRCYKTDKWGNSIDVPGNEIELKEYVWTELEFKVKGSKNSVTCRFEGIIKSEEEIDKALEELGELLFEHLSRILEDSTPKGLLSKTGLLVKIFA